jgi:hypothetical protein
MFYQGMGGGMGGGMGASPSAFTSPGMNPMQLAQLLQMQNGGGIGGMPGMGMGMGGPAMPQPPQNPGAGQPPHLPMPQPSGGPPGAGQPGQGMNLLQMLMQANAMGGQGGLAGMLKGMFGGAPSAGGYMPPGMMPGQDFSGGTPG